MSKSTVTRLFGLAVAALVAGAVIGIVGIVIAIANGAISFGGSQLVTIDGGSLAGAVATLVVATIVITVGTAAAFAAWLGALWNTWQLDDKTWFAALLVLGLGSLGWLALFAYVLKGPDATQAGAAGIRNPAPFGADPS